MKKIMVAMVVVILSFSLTACMPFGALFSVVTLCEDTNASDKKNTKVQTLQSEDGNYSVMMPKHWKEMDELNDEADLEMGRISQEKYMIALIESKMDLDYNFEEWLEFTKEVMLESVTNDKLSKPVEVSVNGYPAIQYVLSGTVDKVNVTYLLTYVDGENNYGQILCWSLKSKYQDAEDEFKEITQSVKGI